MYLSYGVSRHKWSIHSRFLLLGALGLLIVSGLACGMSSRGTATGPEVPVTACRTQGEVKPGEYVAGEKALVAAFRSGSGSDARLVLCFLRTRDGALLKHYDIASTMVVDRVDDQVYVVANNGALCAINLHDGRQQWCQEQVVGSSFSHILSQNGIIYLKVSQTLPGDVVGGDAVFALNAANGQFLWYYDIDRYGGDSLGNFALADGIIYTTTYSDDNERSNPGTSDPKSARRSVCALEANNGKQIWCSRLAETGNVGIAVDGKVYVWTATYEDSWATVPHVALYTLDPLTGALDKRQPLGPLEVRKQQPLFTVSQGVIFFTVGSAQQNDYTEQVLALNANTGNLYWKVTFPVWIWEVWDQSEVLYAGYGAGINVRALRSGDGSQVWQYTTPSQYEPSALQKPVFAQDERSIYVMASFDSYSSILAIDRYTGQPLWQDSSCFNPPVMAVTATPLPNHKPLLPGRCYWGDHASTQPTQLLGFTVL
ncbi:hypothetical protein KSC_097630 [Ktedonobacter sp. SOSP1-52]|nr:hypothetical protein KSC_097630 [Ktedonobacter sp. SOSP1-52]